MSSGKLLALSIIFAIGLSDSTTAETVRQHDSHEHGVSKLKIAIENNKMQFVLEAPAADLVGFEHKPENSEEKAAVARTLELLNTPRKLFKMPLLAACSVLSVEVNFTLAEEQNLTSEHAEEHSEFHAIYLFNCAFPERLTSIGVWYFVQFPNSNEIELQAVSDFGQLSAEISSDQRTIDISEIAK